MHKIARCIDEFSRAGVDFAVNLGDVIDSSGHKARDIESLKRIACTFSKLDGGVYSVLGNHDLESMDKHEFMQALGAKEQQPYFSFNIKDHHFMFLDANFRSDGTEYCKGNYNWEDSFIPVRQEEWVAGDLACCGCGNVMVFIHQNLDLRKKDGAIDPHIVKNAGAIRDILEASGKKITVFQGHYHPGHKQTINGIDYITLEAMCRGADVGSFSHMIIAMDESGNISAEHG